MPPSSVRNIDDLRGPAGQLEAILNTGDDDAPYTALVCHPHPLHGGTMHNKVVYNAMKVFSGFGLPVLRFNFRGAGLSEGMHDGGRGEVDDVRAALTWLTRTFGKPVLFAGFSFGSHVGFRAAGGEARVHGLVALGAPIQAEDRAYRWEFLPACTQPKLFLIGGDDPYCPRNEMEAVFANAPEPKELVWIDGAEHFFQGIPASPKPKLDQMRAALHSWLERTFQLETPRSS